MPGYSRSQVKILALVETTNETVTRVLYAPLTPQTWGERLSPPRRAMRAYGRRACGVGGWGAGFYGLTG